MKNYLQSCLMALLLSVAVNSTAQVPIYSSLPSATPVIFLDFDGHTVNGTSWNYAGPILCGASGMNDTKITEVFNRVAEDYRPFNVNVTTDSTKYWAAPASQRMRVILTVSYEWYGSAGGVAFVNSFSWGDNTPCFVFTSLLNYNSKNISEAASHEAGHTLGMYHQARYDASCVKLSDYHSGTGTGEIGWAPIMGVGYYQNLTLWNIGPNPYGCTNIQNDLTTIARVQNGITIRTDDHSALFPSATSAAFVNNQFTVNGIITQETDQDLFSFTMPNTGRFQLNAIPYNVGTGNAGSNLDLQVTLFNGSQTQLNVYNPGTLLSSVVDTTLNAGTYYLRIEGKGNIYAPNFASLGSYSLQASLTAGGTLPLRRLELTGELSGDRHRLNWLIDADEQVVEQILEVATDGRNFSPVIQPGNNDRTFMYRPYVSTAAQYRMFVTFDNGKSYYSNVVTLKGTGTVEKPKLVTNLISNNLITVNSPGIFSYTVVDMSGKVAVKGQLTNGLNNIPASAINGGMYIIRFVNGNEQWTDKFVKQ